MQIPKDYGVTIGFLKHRVISFKFCHCGDYLSHTDSCVKCLRH